jgi:hypothetical protein
MENRENPQLRLAFDFVQYTGKNVFLTGKAGTGKTTFLHHLKSKSLKRMIVVAPTGVAAINAGGVTIHSFFQMPFGPILPIDDNSTSAWSESEKNPSNIKRFSKDKINIIKSLDLLVIDEISMVRADLLDGVDQVLRRFKDRYKPFGGVQLLMIGDLQQLAPVIKDEEWEILRKYYDTGFFFSSRALQKTDFISIELKHIYRQSDQAFIDLLNKVRENRMDTETLATLNKRHIPGFSQNAPEGYITLTTHNFQAQELNTYKLSKLPGDPRLFKALVDGDFPEYSYPTDFELSLKVGAQVMFVKNDSSREKLYYNGKIGTIVDFEDEVISVKCPGDYVSIPVEPVQWENMKYSVNDETKEIEENIAGTFTQYPLKLAWAITIHKSQGLTFEKAIIDARSAFAHGQVYVALSRCKTMEGLVLSTPIYNQSIKSDSTVLDFTSEIEQNAPGKEKLDSCKYDYQKMLLTELFDFTALQRRLGYCIKLMNEHYTSIHMSLRDVFDRMHNSLKADIVEVSDKFQPQLQQLILQATDIEQNIALQERVKKACTYFADKMNEKMFLILQDLIVDIDNKAVRKPIMDAIGRLKEEVNIKLSCLFAAKEGFVVKTYLETRAKAAIEKPEIKPKQKAKEESKSSQFDHPKLYTELRQWREQKADELNLPFYMILPQKAMAELVNNLPVTLVGLLDIKGFGKKKVKAFGAEIIAIIKKYCKENAVEVSETEPSADEHEGLNDSEDSEKPKKPDTKLQSCHLFTEGKSVEEIASLRGMAVSTIEGHLAHFIGTGELDITKFVTPEKLEIITDYFSTSENLLLGPAKAVLGDNVSYGELRCVLKYLEFKGELKHQNS